MSFNATINGHTQADSKDVEAVFHKAVRELQALPGAADIRLTGYVNEATGGSITLANPEAAEAEAPS